MNKTCKGCFAAEKDGHPISAGEVKGCCLGYKVQDGKPAEECPKPKSWKQLDELKEVEHGK